MVQKNSIIEIPANLHCKELLYFSNPNKTEDHNKKCIITLLQKICLSNILDSNAAKNIDKLQLTEEERSIISTNNWENSLNIEVAARCNDLMRRYSIDKRNNTRKASDAYLDVYQQTKDVKYLIRSVSVRNIKPLNDKTFLDKLKLK